MFAHWFVGIIHWDGGVIRTTSAVGETSYLWLMTWLLPSFFPADVGAPTGPRIRVRPGSCAG